MSKLDGKAAIITGGSSGIGLATARAFLAEGARVIITGRRQAHIDAALAQLGERAIGVAGDVGSMFDLDRLMVEAKRWTGAIDILVANAGLNELAALADVEEASFDRLVLANAKGAFFSVQKALPILNDGGSIIVTGSIAAHRAMDGHAVYAGTKGFVRASARNWAKELLPRRIRVNVLTPGPVRTAMVDSLGLDARQRAALDMAIAGMVPLGRWGEPNDLAQAAVFLASHDSSFVTGTELFVDGGLAQL